MTLRNVPFRVLTATVSPLYVALWTIPNSPGDKKSEHRVISSNLQVILPGSGCGWIILVCPPYLIDWRLRPTNSKSMKKYSEFKVPDEVLRVQSSENYVYSSLPDPKILLSSEISRTEIMREGGIRERSGVSPSVTGSEHKLYSFLSTCWSRRLLALLCFCLRWYLRNPKMKTILITMNNDITLAIMAEMMEAKKKGAV